MRSTLSLSIPLVLAALVASSSVACGSAQPSITISDDAGVGDDAETSIPSDDAAPDTQSQPDTAVTPTPDAQPPSAGGVISTSSASAMESETHIVARPDGSLVAAWIAVGASGAQSDIGYAISSDGGATWLPAKIISALDGRQSSDPVLATNAQGDTFLTWLGLRFDSSGNASDMVLYVSVAKKGETTFATPVAVTTDATVQYDKPWITVLPDGAVVVTYAKTSTGGMYSARSTDGGATWTNVTIVEDGSFRNLIFPCYDTQKKRLYATYHAGGGIGLRFSDDGGQTWNPNGLAVAQMGEQPAFDDPTCVASNGEVWVSYGLTTDTGNSEQNSPKLNAIKIAHSPDSGASIDHWWDALEGAPYGMHPYLVQETAGALDLAYYAGASEGDKNGSLRYRRSTDGGATWATSIVLHEPVLFTGARASQQWLGDYFGLDAAAGTLHVSYVTNLPVVSHVAYTSAKLP